MNLSSKANKFSSQNEFRLSRYFFSHYFPFMLLEQMQKNYYGTKQFFPFSLFSFAQILYKKRQGKTKARKKTNSRKIEATRHEKKFFCDKFLPFQKDVFYLSSFLCWKIKSILMKIRHSWNLSRCDWIFLFPISNGLNF